MDQPSASRSAKPGQRLFHRRCSLFLALAMLAGCAPPLLRQAHPAELQAEWLAFLVDGKSTREEVLLRLGTPSARFEGERILTYAFSRSPNGGWVREVRSRAGGTTMARADHFVPAFRSYRVNNLVLVFTADGRLARHSLVVPE